MLRALKYHNQVTANARYKVGIPVSFANNMVMMLLGGEIHDSHATHNSFLPESCRKRPNPEKMRDTSVKCINSL